MWTREGREKNWQINLLKAHSFLLSPPLNSSVCCLTNWFLCRNFCSVESRAAAENEGKWRKREKEKKFQTLHGCRFSSISPLEANRKMNYPRWINFPFPCRFFQLASQSCKADVDVLETCDNCRKPRRINLSAFNATVTEKLCIASTESKLYFFWHCSLRSANDMPLTGWLAVDGKALTRERRLKFPNDWTFHSVSQWGFSSCANFVFMKRKLHLCCRCQW